MNLYTLMKDVDSAVAERQRVPVGEFPRARAREKHARDRLEEAVLDAEKRGKLKKSQFAMAGRKYPIHDRAHAISALAYAKQHGDLATVKPKVCKKYPDLPACSEADD